MSADPYGDGRVPLAISAKSMDRILIWLGAGQDRARQGRTGQGRKTRQLTGGVPRVEGGQGAGPKGREGVTKHRNPWHDGVFGGEAPSAPSCSIVTAPLWTLMLPGLNSGLCVARPATNSQVQPRAPRRSARRPNINCPHGAQARQTLAIRGAMFGQLDTSILACVRGWGTRHTRSHAGPPYAVG